MLSAQPRNMFAFAPSPARAAKSSSTLRDEDPLQTSAISDTSNQHFSVRAPRPIFLPGANGVDFEIPQTRNPFLRPGAEESGNLPMIAAPILVRIDGGNPDSSLSGGLDSCGRLVPLDRTKFALFHIPSAVYPLECARQAERHDNPLTSDAQQPQPLHNHRSDESDFWSVQKQPFVPLSLPAFSAECLQTEGSESSSLYEEKDANADNDSSN